MSAPRPPRHRRLSRSLAVLVAVLLSAPLVAAALPPASAASHPNAVIAAKKGVKPGLDGSPILVEDQASFSGYDLDTDASTGTAYLGWISSTAGLLRSVHLCVLPPGATGCAGGVLTTTPGDGASAAGVQVNVISPGVVRLTWFYDGPGYGKLAEATYSGGVLSGTTTFADAPDNGALLDAVLSPAGQLWLVTQDASTLGPQHVHVLNGATPVADLTAPYMVGKAALAFDGQTPVIVVDKYGAVSETVLVTSGPGWGGFTPVPKTWSLGGLEDLVGTSRGIRLISSEDDAGYRPVVAKWKGGSFGKPELTGDSNSCAPSSHDLVTDASGRAADVANECGEMAIANLADTEHAGMARFPSGGTPAGGVPQITTTSRGFGWVAWGILSPVAANRLLVAPIRLPALTVEKTRKSGAGSVTVSGPADCLPVVTAKAKVKAKPGRGWHLLSRELRLNGKDVGSSTSIHGEKAKSGEKFKLTGTAVFRKGSQTARVSSKTLKFSAC
jgi:hypothetical protein